MSDKPPSDKPVVGVIGLGIMGGAFAKNVLKAGFTVVGHDLVSQQVETLTNAGGYDGHSPREVCLLYTSPSPRDRTRSRMPSSA